MSEWRIDGFREVRELGSGAQGRVVLARHETAGTPVAIKYLLRGPDVERERLRHEAVLLGRVSDPHVARLYRLVESEYGAAIVMEAVNGVSLKRVLSEHGALGAEASLTVLKGSLNGLAAAHAVGVVHRDYKPANVVVQADGLSKLIDFGVAVPQGADGRSGTPAYMPPEQWRGEAATPAADVYAATCVFFECVTGQRPFRGSGPELMAKHLNAEIPVDVLPEALRDLVGRGMAKDPAGRPAGAAAFVEELERVAVAAYGVDWERRGVRALAGTAVALAALFPLVAAGIGSAAPVTAGAAAGAAGAAAGTAGAGSAAAGAGAGTAGAGTAAGSVGSAAAGGGAATGSAGILATAGGKAAVIVAGSAVVTGAGGTAAYTALDDDETAPRTRTVAATVATYNESAERLVVRNSQYVRVSGLGDPALEARINKALRAPMDETIARVRRQTRQMGAQCTQDSQVSTAATVGLKGPAFVSVVYKVRARFCLPSDGALPGQAVTVNVKTGRALGPEDVFKPETMTESGTRTMIERMTRIEGDPLWVTPNGCAERYPARRDFYPQNLEGLGERPPAVTPFLTPNAFVFNYSIEGSACRYGRFSAPYAKVRDLLKPEFTELLPDGPAPART